MYQGSESSLDVMVTRWAQIIGIKESKVDVFDGLRVEAGTEAAVPDDVADDTGADPPLGRVHAVGHAEDANKPRASP